MAGVREELAKCYRNAEKERTSFLTMLQEKEHLVGELRQAASDANGRLEAAVADTQIRERDQMQATIAQMVAGMVEDRAKLRQGIRDEIQTEFEANKAQMGHEFAQREEAHLRRLQELELALLAADQRIQASRGTADQIAVQTAVELARKGFDKELEADRVAVRAICRGEAEHMARELEACQAKERTLDEALANHVDTAAFLQARLAEVERTASEEAAGRASLEMELRLSERLLSEHKEALEEVKSNLVRGGKEDAAMMRQLWRSLSLTRRVPGQALEALSLAIDASEARGGETSGWMEISAAVRALLATMETLSPPPSPVKGGTIPAEEAELLQREVDHHKEEAARMRTEAEAWRVQVYSREASQLIEEEASRGGEEKAAMREQVSTELRAELDQRLDTARAEARAELEDARRMQSVLVGQVEALQRILDEERAAAGVPTSPDRRELDALEERWAEDREKWSQEKKRLSDALEALPGPPRGTPPSMITPTAVATTSPPNKNTPPAPLQREEPPLWKVPSGPEAATSPSEGWESGGTPSPSWQGGGYAVGSEEPTEPSPSPSPRVETPSPARPPPAPREGSAVYDPSARRAEKMMMMAPPPALVPESSPKESSPKESRAGESDGMAAAGFVSPARSEAEAWPTPKVDSSLVVARFVEGLLQVADSCGAPREGPEEGLSVWDLCQICLETPFEDFMTWLTQGAGDTALPADGVMSREDLVLSAEGFLVMEGVIQIESPVGRFSPMPAARVPLSPLSPMTETPEKQPPPPRVVPVARILPEFEEEPPGWDLPSLRHALNHRHITLGHLFTLMDADRTNSVSMREFVRGLELSGVRPVPSEEEMIALFNEADGDDNRLISYEELSHAIHGPPPETPPPRLPRTPVEEAVSTEPRQHYQGGITPEAGRDMQLQQADARSIEFMKHYAKPLSSEPPIDSSTTRSHVEVGAHVERLELQHWKEQHAEPEDSPPTVELRSKAAAGIRKAPLTPLVDQALKLAENEREMDEALARLKEVPGLVVIGGLNNTAECYFPLENKVVPMPSTNTRRSCAAAAAIGGYIYVVGGWDSACQSTVERYQPGLDPWTRNPPGADRWDMMASMQQRRSQLAAVGLQGKLYALGGRDDAGLFLNSVERYSVDLDCWRPVAPMLVERCGMGAAVREDKLYVVGGFNGRCRATVEVYNPDANAWQPVAPLRSRRAYLAVVSCDKFVYAVGGFDGGYLKTVERYDVERDVWEDVAPMGIARSSAAACEWNGYIYVFGGWNGIACHSVERYNPSADTWEYMTKLQTDRVGLCCCTHYPVPG